MSIENEQRDLSKALPEWAVVLVHLLFFLSGATALIYEVVWMRLLSFVFGNTTYAVSVVLAVFLGGLAVGAYLFGRLADRRGDLLRLYGMLEAGAALIALALPYLLLELLSSVYTWIYQWAGESILALTVARLLLSGVLLAGPAVLLGGTLPVLVRFLVRRDAGMEAGIGRLYGLNTLGAVAGSFAAGFALMPALGLRLSNASGAALGLLVAITAVIAHRALGRRAAVDIEWRPAPTRQSAPPEEQRVKSWLLVAFALSGFAALAYEVMWTRLLAYYFEAFVYAFSAMLCVYLLGLALGSLLYSLVLSRFSKQIKLFVVLEVLIGLTAAATIPGFLMLADRLKEVSIFEFRSLISWMFVSAAIIMILPTILIGAVFPLVGAIWARTTGRIGLGIGEVYLVNTIGTVAGSLAAGFAVVPALGTRVGLVTIAGVNIFAGLLVWAVVSRARWQGALRLVVAVGIPLLVIGVLNKAVTAEDFARIYQHGLPIKIEWVTEGMDGTVTIERGTGQGDAVFGMGTDRRLSINGVNVAGTRFDFHTTQKLQAHLGLLIHQGAKRVLQIGFGSGGTAYSASLHPLERIDCVEISRTVLSAAPKFEETNHGVLNDPRVHVYIEDARSFVRHTPHQYDVILSDSTHPNLAGEGLLYSVDYLRDCAKRLKPGGIFSTWLPVYALSLENAQVIIRSIRAAFPYVYIWHTSIGRNEWCIVHGMVEPLDIDCERFAEEMALPGVEEDLAEIGMVRPEDILGLLLYDHKAVDRWVGEGDPLNTDDNGYLEFIGPKSAFSAGSRKRLWLLTFPGIIENSGGSVLDYTSGSERGGWAERIGREEAANRHILNGRLYEFAGSDERDLLALREYERALALSPDNFVAQVMIGIAPRQIDALMSAADGEADTQLILDQLVAALTATGRIEEAANWAAIMTAQSLPEPGPQIVMAVLRGRWEEVEQLIRNRRTLASGEILFMGSSRAAYEDLVAAERSAAVNPRDATLRWRAADRYDRLVDGIRNNTRPYRRTSMSFRLRSFRLRAIAELLEKVRKIYAEAAALSPDDENIRLRLALVDLSLGEYASARTHLKRVAGGGGLQANRAKRMLKEVDIAEREPFAFISEMQAIVRSQTVR